MARELHVACTRVPLGRVRGADNHISMGIFNTYVVVPQNTSMIRGCRETKKVKTLF